MQRWTHPQPIPPVPLVDHTGRAFTLDAYDDDWLALTFLFTECPLEEMCPATTRRLVQLGQLWSSTPKPNTELSILAITLDPQRDTPERLAEFAHQHGVDPTLMRLATGEQRLVSQDLPSLFNVIGLPDGQGNISHTMKVALLRPGRVPVAEWKDDDWTADQLMEAVNP